MPFKQWITNMKNDFQELNPKKLQNLFFKNESVGYFLILCHWHVKIPHPENAVSEPKLFLASSNSSKQKIWTLILPQTIKFLHDNPMPYFCQLFSLRKSFKCTLTVLGVVKLVKFDFTQFLFPAFFVPSYFHISLYRWTFTYFWCVFLPSTSSPFSLMYKFDIHIC